MTAPTLCPSPLNELDKGIFAPERETSLLDEGYVFACRVPGTLVGTLLVCKRPIAQAVTAGELDSPRYLRIASASAAPIPQPVP